MIKLLPWFIGKKIYRILDPNRMRRYVRFSAPEFITLSECDSTEIFVNINDHIGYRIFFEKSFDSVPMLISEELGIGPDDFILDIGANIGSVSIPLSKKLGCGILCVEASTENIQLLAKNCFYNNIKAFIVNAAAVSPDMLKNNFLDFFVNPGNTGGNSIFKNWISYKGASQKTVFAKTITIDSLSDTVDFKKFKLVKIDIEGAELLALEGMSKILKLKIPILLEYRVDSMRKYLSDDGYSVLDFLELNNYFLYEIRKLNNEISYHPVDKDRSSSNIIATPLELMEEKNEK